MRKLLLAGLCLLLSLGLSAQKKGDFSVGTTAGATYTDVSGHSWGAAVSADVSYFVFNKWKVSLSAGYTYQQQGRIAGNGALSSAHTLVVGPSISYYAKLAKGLYYTPEFGAYYAFGGNWQRASNLNIHLTMRGYQLGLSLFALEIKPSDKLGITVSVASIAAGELWGYDAQGHCRAIAENLDGLFNMSSTMGVRFYF
jgi:hypothetical protein